MTISTAIDPAAVARVVGIKTEYKNLRGGSVLFLPQRVAVVGQGSTTATYDTTKRQVTSAIEAANLYGFGSPIHLAVLQLLPANGDGVGTIPVTVYPLEDAGSGVASTGDITPAGTPTEAAAYRVKVNNILSEEFVISVGDSVADRVTAMTAAINAVLEMPVIATDATPGTSTEVGISSKWKGTSANDIYLEVVGSTTAGNTFAFTQPAGGLVNPDVDDALNQIGDVWETMILNCLDIADTTTLDKYSDFGEGRWGATTKKPLMVFSGETEANANTAATLPDGRKTDRVNVQLVAPGSDDLPFVVASRELARIVVVAASNPPKDYGSQSATGLTPGTDGEQWNYITKDATVKKGSSTTDVRDGVVTLSDTVTFYHPTGDPTPAYRYVVDIVKLQNIIFNTNLIFESTEWDGAPLIPDGDATVNPEAKRPSDAKAAVAAMLDSLGLNAIVSRPDLAKESILAGINGSNPKRLDLSFDPMLSGNSNIISIDLNFGFYFG